MRDNPSRVQDLLKLGENALGILLGARHELGAQARSGLANVSRRLDLVTREEFDAALAMIAKARAMQEDLNERLGIIEAQLGIAKTSKTKKVNLRSVKQGKEKANRKR